MTSNESIVTKPDFTIMRGAVNPLDHDKPKVEKPIFAKVVSIVQINPDGSHEVLINRVRRCSNPATKLAKPDLVMKRVPRYSSDGKIVCHEKTIHVNKTLQKLGITLEELFATQSRVGSTEHRLKIAYTHTKTMTPEPDDIEISIGQR